MDLRPELRGIAPVSFGTMLAKQQPSDRQGRRAYMGRVHKRRFASLQAAAEAVDTLPEEGEALHVIMSGKYDLMHLLIVLLERFACRCASMRIATLSLSRRNVQEMGALLDAGKVGTLDLLTSDFFRKHDDDIFAELLMEFGNRGQRVAAARSHCKIVTLALDDGRRYTLEGSANLRTNKNLEQFALSQDKELFAFYDSWILDMVTKNEVKPSDGTTKS
jgi:hypothetical protein